MKNLKISCILRACAEADRILVYLNGILGLYLTIKELYLPIKELYLPIKELYLPIKELYLLA